MMKIILLTTFLIICITADTSPIGLERIFPNERIIGGEPVNIEDYPHQVSLQYYGSHRCGGSFIRPNVILTAAHCVIDTIVDSLQVRVGSSYKNSGGELADVNDYEVNENYSWATIDYDIAIVILDRNFDYGPTIQPIEMATVEANSGDLAIVSGWGNMQEGGTSPTQLHSVAIRIISNADCRKYYGDSKITDRMMCAGIPEGGKGSCQGDSGGALIVNRKVVGVVSWAEGCSRPNVPTVFGNVVNLLQWVHDQLHELEMMENKRNYLN